ncbi:MAG TPA: DinB family protein [Longimicrobiaceae bacterium]|nr:DinB family protein [Longimicrobiaceae bacterium]
MQQPEVWLRGPVEGVPPVLMPAAHALLQSAEDLRRVTLPLTVRELWITPGGAASVGFHLRHVAGSIDRLLTYARGEGLDDRQRAALAAEGEPGDPPEEAAPLVEGAEAAIRRAVETLRSTPEGSVFEPRKVGRAGLPSTVLGLLFHLAEHTQRHTGQVIATARIVRGLGLVDASR